MYQLIETVYGNPSSRPDLSLTEKMIYIYNCFYLIEAISKDIIEIFSISSHIVIFCLSLHELIIT